MAAGDVDLGFIEGSRPPGRLRSKEVLADELEIVVPAGHPWSRRRRPISAKELAKTPLVLRERDSGTREVLTAALGVQGLGVTAAMELGSTTAIKAAVVTGAGPAVLSALAGRTPKCRRANWWQFPARTSRSNGPYGQYGHPAGPPLWPRPVC